MKRDITYEHEANPGDYGKIKGEWYAVPPGYRNPDGSLPFIYLERAAHPPWVVTENPDGTITVDPPFKLGDHAVHLVVKLKGGFWGTP